MVHRLLRPTLTALLLAWSATSSAQQAPPIAPAASAWRPPQLQVQGAEQPVRLQALRLEVEVAGGVAQTRVRMDFYNPNGRTLEGKLQFPLADGQVVTGFALDVGDELRDAVPVEKARAAQVFEDIARRGVDPGLLQTTVGNNYELRIYPLPPGKTRTVVLTLTEPAAPSLQIPLAYAGKVAAFELLLRYPTAAAAPTIASANPLGLRFERDREGGYGAHIRGGETVLPVAGLLVRTAAPTGLPEITTERRDGHTYFTLGFALAERHAARPLPKKMQLIWDASGSAASRRFEREFALLDAYFRRAGNVEVNLVRVADVADRAERFDVRQGDWQALRRALDDTVYDGASNLGAVTHDGVSQEALWFSDGLANYGASWSLKFAVPVYAINSAPVANPAALRQLAENSGGQWLDLNTLSTRQAEHTLLQRGWQLLGVSAVGAQDVVAQSVHPEQGALALAGVLTADVAVLTLRLRGPDGAVVTKTVQVGADANPSRLAAAQWARIKLAQLQGEARLNRGQIRELGRRFAIATSETSLLVLERVEDYVEHEIEPPPALRVAYDRLAANAHRTKSGNDAARLAQLVRRFEARVAWWGTDFPKGEPPRAVGPAQDVEIAGAVGSRADSARRERAPAAPPPSAAPMNSSAAQAQPLLRQALAGDAMKKAGVEEPSSSIAIALKPASRAAPYVKRLQAAEANEWSRIYIDERHEYASSVGFYLDVAEFFFGKKQNALALRVLSNLAEMDLQNRQILRLLGYRLTQAGEVALALPVFERVLELAPQEPQSHRDLGLALAQAGQRQRAIERLYEVASGQWDVRFPDIDLIALGELNTVVDEAARAGRPLDTAFIEPKLLRNLPLDLRVLLAWDADNTDVDLHVIDPNGEEVYYGHNASYQGGAITRDATGGYGPEEFALRVAKPGKYRVEANFFGHRQQVLASSTGLMLWLSSGWGSARQQDQRSTVRVKSERGERIVIGEFEVRR